MNTSSGRFFKIIIIIIIIKLPQNSVWTVLR